jgi:hypothetical protein
MYRATRGLLLRPRSRTIAAQPEIDYGHDIGLALVFERTKTSPWKQVDVIARLVVLDAIPAPQSAFPCHAGSRYNDANASVFQVTVKVRRTRK